MRYGSRFKPRDEDKKLTTVQPHSHLTSTNELSPFARAALEAFDIDYACEVSHRHAFCGGMPEHASERNGPDRLKKSAATISHHRDPTWAQRGHFEPSNRGRLLVARNQEPIPQESTMQPRIVVPDVPLSYHPDQYKNYEGSWALQKGSHTSVANGTPDHYPADTKSGHDSALQELELAISEIFDAEDELQIRAHDAGANVFIAWPDAAPSMHVLACHHQVKLESLLHKAISVGRFMHADVDSISRVQRICENALTLAQDLDIRIHPECHDAEYATWSDRLDLVENGLRASQTALRIMTGQRPEKKLVSEELLQGVIRLLAHVTRECIVPVVEARPTGPTSRIFQAAIDHKKVLLRIVHSADRAMCLLWELLRKEPLAESCINNAQFLGLHLLFVENPASEKDSVIGVQKLENYRRHAMDVITEIFGLYPEQRRFLIDEVLSSLQKLPTTRQRARQYRLADGKRLQLTTVLLMKFVQNSATNRGRDGTSEERDSPRPHDSNSVERDSSEDRSSQGSTSIDQVGPDAASGAQLRGAEIACRLYKSAAASVHHIVRYLVHRASTAFKTGETPHRHLLDLFVEDLIGVVSSPEWPASNLLLIGLMSNMVEIAESHQSPAPAKNMALETLGVIGATVLEVACEARQFAHSLEADESQAAATLLQQYGNHVDGRLDAADMIGENGIFRCVVGYLLEQGQEGPAVTAAAYHLTHWTKIILWGHNTPCLPVQTIKGSQAHTELAGDLCSILQTGHLTSPA